MERSTDYLILVPLNPTKNPSKIFSISASAIPSWLLNLSNYLNNWISWVLDFWFWGKFWNPFDRLPAPSLVRTSALISKLPSSGMLTPSRITLSKSPILDLLVSMFLLILLIASLIALLVATSANITSFLLKIIVSFFLSSAYNWAIWFYNSISRALCLLSLYSRLLIFFSSYTICVSFSFKRPL